MNKTEDVCFSVITAQHRTWKKCHTKTEGRPYSALVLRMKSSATLHLQQTTLVSKPNDILYTPANTAYTADYPNDGEIIFIHFTDNIPFFSGIQNFSPVHFEEFYSLFLKISSICTLKKQNYKIEAASVLLQIVVYLSKLKNETFESNKFEKAIRILRNEYTDHNLKISDICKRADISSSYLRKRFSEEYGIAPIRYLNELRIDHAQKLLISSHCSTENAALKSGFSDYRYFARVTKKLRGITPSMLRNT